MNDFLSQTKAKQLGNVNDSATLRIYLDYRVLRLSDLRSILADFERAYNRFDSSAAWNGGRFRSRTPLSVSRIETGNSIEVILAGSSLPISILAELLSQIASHCTVGSLTTAGTLILAGLKGRKMYWEAELKKQESIKAARENELASAPVVPKSVDGDERVVRVITTRMRRIRSSPRIRKMVIDADGRRFVVTDRHHRMVEEKLPAGDQ